MSESANLGFLARRGAVAACSGLPHRAVLAMAGLDPSREAIIFRGRATSYQELATRVTLLARLLRDAAVGPEEVVGVCLPRTPDAVAALLAILLVGGVYLPLDPSLPEERRNFM